MKYTITLVILLFFTPTLLISLEQSPVQKKADLPVLTGKLPSVDRQALEEMLKKVDLWFEKAFSHEEDSSGESVPSQKATYVEPPATDDMLKMLDTELESHNHISAEIWRLILEAYLISYEEERADDIADADESEYLSWCTCHARSLRIALLVAVAAELTQKFPNRDQKITAVILAPGDLLQEYVLGHLLLNVLGYKKVEFHCIDLGYNDPQFDPVSFRLNKKGDVIGPRFKKLSSKEEAQKKRVAGKKKKGSKVLKEARKEYILSEQPLKRLVKLLNAPSFTLEYFRHSYGYLDWAQSRKVQPQVMLMVDPYPVGEALTKYEPGESLFKTLTAEESFASSYPSANNVLLCGMRQRSGEALNPFPMVIIRPHMPGAPTVLYLQELYLQAMYIGDASEEKLKKTKLLFEKLRKIVHQNPHEPTPWSDLYGPLYDILGSRFPGGTTKKGKPRTDIVLSQESATLACDPYIAFEDIAQSIGMKNSIIYWSFKIYEYVPGKEKADEQTYIRPYNIVEMKKRLEQGEVIPEIAQYLKVNGYVKVFPAQNPKSGVLYTGD